MQAREGVRTEQCASYLPARAQKSYRSAEAGSFAWPFWADPGIVGRQVACPLASLHAKLVCISSANDCHEEHLSLDHCCVPSSEGPWTVVTAAESRGRSSRIGVSMFHVYETVVSDVFCEHFLLFYSLSRVAAATCIISQASSRRKPNSTKPQGFFDSNHENGPCAVRECAMQLYRS
ncbi:unnamed protein product [Cercospora beticola]|nr:unnamed protein product [Cercospora beticola]